MRKWKWMTAAALSLFLACGVTAGAYDLAALAKTTLPKNFSYKEISQTETLHFGGTDIPYTMGQLQVLLSRRQSFASGYIVQAKMPFVMAENLKPFFRLNPSEKEWAALVSLNRALLDEDSQLRKNINATLLALAVNSVGPLAEKDVQVVVREIEPFRRLSSDEAYLYTAGGLVLYTSGGLVFPMYCRAYFFPGDNGLQALLLFAPDEGKGPLVYAIDDLAKAAAKEDLLGSEGYKDLGTVLAQGQTGE